MSYKNLDDRGRFRSRTIAFRVSPEEGDLIDAAVRLSGLTKQDYIVRKLTDRSVIVTGNPKVYKALRNELMSVLNELRRIDNAAAVDPDLTELIRLIVSVLEPMRKEAN